MWNYLELGFENSEFFKIPRTSVARLEFKIDQIGYRYDEHSKPFSWRTLSRFYVVLKPSANVPMGNGTLLFDRIAAYNDITDIRLSMVTRRTIKKSDLFYVPWEEVEISNNRLQTLKSGKNGELVIKIQER